jgi:hypothetical protein
MKKPQHTNPSNQSTNDGAHVGKSPSQRPEMESEMDLYPIITPCVQWVEILPATIGVLGAPGAQRPQARNTARSAAERA